MNNVKGAVKAIACGGFTAGTIDIGSACLINWLSPVVILHAIASGVLGRTSFYDGVPSAVLGLLLQWGMALVIAAIFMVAAVRLSWLVRRWIAAGLLYGLVIFAVMNYLVLPLSAAAPPHYFTVQHLLHRFTADKFFENLAAMFLFGLIVAWFARRFLDVSDAQHRTGAPAAVAPGEAVEAGPADGTP